MGDKNMEVIDLERGLSFISDKSWAEIPSPALNNFRRCNFTQSRSKDNPKFETQQSKTDTVKGTADNYRNITLSRYANTFIESVGVQGVRYVFMRDANWVRRLCWALLCLAASGYCWYVSITNFNNFLTYPTATKTTVEYANRTEFPAVTICNYNIFTKTKLNSSQVEMLDDMYKPFDMFVNETDQDPNRYNHVDMDEFLTNASFDYRNNLGFCTYQGRPCNLSYVYIKVRDVGTCMTFDPSEDEKLKYQYLGGREGGLTIGMGRYETDWTPGPFMNLDGLIAMVHDPNDDVVMVENFGTSVPIGHTVNLVVSQKKVKLLPPPHGQCGFRKLKYYDNYTQLACRTECNFEFMVKTCGCKLWYMPKNESVPTCNNLQIMACRKKFLGNVLSDTGAIIRDECNCPPECEKTEYSLAMQQTMMSEGTRQYIIDNYYGFDLKTSGVEFRVYYPTLSYTTQTEEATYTVEKLLCDVGGAGGLFLGASFMSFIEVVDFVLYMMWLLSVKTLKKNQTKKAVNPRVDDLDT